ncbi:uncharacterized protein RSE6_05306 [Rhynchosporium secalis]|uniref:Uncharacterized protein n=1 Tax=Rhynchosporium secalis TaxID=38038 RepID=A0A1E1M7F2_RHYSE|nr:uncharacterized protein RSE6_05306 [Rhynchosporium secalis]
MALLPNILGEGDIFLITCVDVKAMRVQGTGNSSPKCCFFEGRNARAKVPITYQNQVQTSGLSSMTSISEQCKLPTTVSFSRPVPRPIEIQSQLLDARFRTGRLSSHIPIDWYQMKGYSPKERGFRRRLDNALVFTWPCNTPEEQQDFALLRPSFSFADLIQFISHPCPYRAFTGNHAKYCVQ